MNAPGHFESSRQDKSGTVRAEIYSTHLAAKAYFLVETQQDQFFSRKLHTRFT